MSRISTPITTLLKCEIPIISAPMGDIAMAELASSVTASGGFGFIGTAFLPAKDMKLEIAKARNILGVKPGDSIPIGVGLIGWILDKTEISNSPCIPAVLEEKPAAVWLAFGVNMGKYVDKIRAYDAQRNHKTTVFVMVNSEREALKAANEWKADVLVVQGNEAGGHGGSGAPPLLALLRSVLDVLPNGPPVVAAGGISSGDQVAALLTMGAAGAVLGTRFLFTHESQYNDVRYKQVLLSADIHSTTRSTAFDEARGATEWPHKCDGRAISNSIIDDFKAGLDINTRRKHYDEDIASGNTSRRLVVYAGTGVGLTNKLTSTAEVVNELRHGIMRSLRRMSLLIL
ncbi:2-nitropropane dioxygenase [Cyathus striatus]|nr:2-nitropropane dioxygenase [Cyathus striatus]